jgi:hypothetical protein
MITYDQHTLRLLGIPLFTLVVLIVCIASIAALLFGVVQWRQPSGKIFVITSAFILLLIALAIILVLVTVGLGTMG